LFPQIHFNLTAIEGNTRRVAELCHPNGMSLFGVTKVVAGDPEIGRAMLTGGAAGLADARLANLQRLRQAGLGCPLLLLRASSPKEAGKTVQWADLSIQSNEESLRELDREAGRNDRLHQVLLAVECGDLREGLMPERLLEVTRAFRDWGHLVLAGLATNFGCLSGVLPTPESIGDFLSLATQVAEEAGHPLIMLSAGATVCLSLLERGEMPEGVNQLRIGEAIVCGTDTSGAKRVPGTRQDTAFLLAEVIEVEEKPSLPWGPLGRDAFGVSPLFHDQGRRIRAILALGRVDCELDELEPEEAGLEVIGASSDHLLVDVTARGRRTLVGEVLSFRAGYHAILRACTSPYVEKRYQFKELKER
jgi:predicted amino acid racemase